MENLIGLSGEIHAYRRLQQIYGHLVVSPSSWLSSSSLHVYPDNKQFANDSIGCDFRFSVDEVTCHIEVKASEGDDESYTLGSSEIRLAMELSRANRRKRQKDSLIILRVTKALTTEPEFQVIPNPYDPFYRSCFVIEEADARVRYRVAQQ